MTPEELLKPRYKVIAIDTTESFQVGEILNHPSEWHDFIWVGPSGKIIFYPEKYPHLFKKLEWWEELKPEDLPQYVQVISAEIAKDTGVYCKVFKWSVIELTDNKGDLGAEIDGYEPIYLCRPEFNFPGQVYGMLHVSHLQPATAAEYEAYLQTLTVK